MQDDLRERAIKTLKRKRKRIDDIGLYVAVNGVLWFGSSGR